MQAQTRIARLSTWLYWATIPALVLLPLVAILAVASSGFSGDTLASEFPGLQIADPLSNTQLAMVRLAGAIPFIIIMLILDQLRCLLAAYREARIFVPETVRHLHRIGLGLLALAVSQIVVRTVQILILTWSNPAGERTLSIGLSDAELGFLFAGGFVTLIGWVMSEATRLSDENRTFV
ncbi:DUF2975 domain-containing protein [Aestuariibius insulae]|uniref:DUF2975 domain-containing protein n=1 Tax=Aestuariibius insulae TaxID=2058287 RepID=UPI00345E1B4C